MKPFQVGDLIVVESNNGGYLHTTPGSMGIVIEVLSVSIRAEWIKLNSKYTGGYDDKNWIILIKDIRHASKLEKALK